MARAELGLPEQISEKIIQLILDEHLEQGDRLPKEAVLVERLGAGRSTVREAMKLLQSRNIVRIKQARAPMWHQTPALPTIRWALPLSMTRGAWHATCSKCAL